MSPELSLSYCLSEVHYKQSVFQQTLESVRLGTIGNGLSHTPSFPQHYLLRIVLRFSFPLAGQCQPGQSVGSGPSPSRLPQVQKSAFGIRVSQGTGGCTWAGTAVRTVGARLCSQSVIRLPARGGCVSGRAQPRSCCISLISGAAFLTAPASARAVYVLLRCLFEQCLPQPSC